MLTLKKVKEMVKAPVHTKRVPSPKVLLEDGRILLRKEFEHDSHLTLYHSGYVWFSAGKRNTVFHIHDCRGDYAYGASKGKGEVIKEEYFENCEWHIRALFEGEQRVEESQLKCEGVGQTKVCVSYHAVSEDWGEMADSEINVLDKYIEKEALHAMMAVLTKKQRNLIYQNYVLDKTHQEIADGMGIARGSVTRSVNQALERIHVLLKNKGFDTIARKNMNRKQTGRYDAYNLTYGNRPELFGAGSPTYSGGTTGSIGTGGGAAGSGGFKYDIPSEALSDEKFARMIEEAEKYLGMPYVWGGSSPSTSFDCSGFVCWVINNSGNGWSVGRTTANGLRGKCSYVPPADAQPGDLIFFEKTYNTVGASHVGIYVGNGMMIHCGDPISYTSINSTYWQSHFLGFGRIN